jgi:uncharacterized protein YggE
MRPFAIAVLLTTLALTAPAVAAADQTITALGTGQAKVKPANRNKNASILRAVEKAYARAVPRAIAHAREDALEIAAASGLKLGPIQSVDANVNSGGPYYYAPGGIIDPFGPGQYCGKIRRRVHRRDAAGRLHTVTRIRRRCIVPEFATTSLAVTFEATPR